MERTWAYRFGVLSRTLAAVAGGYCLASILAILLARSLPLPAASALMTALLLGFLLHAAAVIWVFAARTALRAWVGLLVPAVLAVLLARLFQY